MAGFDIALGARTLHEGEAREHSSTIAKSDTRPLPGSLDSTAALVDAEGQRALAVYLDLLDRSSLGAAVATVLERWGRIDVLVNNGRYSAPSRIVWTRPVSCTTSSRSDVLAPIILSARTASMLERGEADLTWHRLVHDGSASTGRTRWMGCIRMSKAALHRIAGLLGVELGDQGIRAYNLSPGFVATERIAMDMGEFGFDASRGAPASVIGAVASWLVTAPEARALNGQWIEAQPKCRELGLLPDWS